MKSKTKISLSLKSSRVCWRPGPSGFSRNKYTRNLWNARWQKPHPPSPCVEVLMPPPCPSPASHDLGVAVCVVGFVRTLPQTFANISAFFRSQGRASFFGVVSSSGNDTAKGQWRDMSQPELLPALRALAPVEWEDTTDTRGPRCGLLCMPQFDRLERCREMVSARERSCGGRFAWVVKARPDVTIYAGEFSNRSVAASGLNRSDTVYVDRQAGDLVSYIPREHWEAFSHLLSTATCEKIRSVGVDCMHDAAATGGGGCKCNSWLKKAATRLLKLQVAPHPFAMQIVRTSESLALFREARSRFGKAAMIALHNKSRRSEDLQHLSSHSRRHCSPCPGALVPNKFSSLF